MNTPTKTYKITCLSRAISPITHMAGVEGNEAILRTDRVRTDRGVVDVPCLSGNALRHRMVREPAARYIVDACGLAGKLSLEQLNFLFHAGNLTQGGGRVNTRVVCEMYRLLPLLRLLGCALPSHIPPGSMICRHGMLVCRENRDRLARQLPDGFELPAGVLASAASCVSSYQYTRQDARNSAPELAKPSELADAVSVANEASNMMIFSGQQVIAGSLFMHGFIVKHAMEIEIGALLHSIGLWMAGGATIGGQAARGHGILHAALHISPEIDQERAIASYVQHVADHADEIAAFLDAIFEPPPKTRVDAKKSKAKRPPLVSTAEGESDGEA